MPGNSEHPVTLGDLRVSESMGFGSHKKWSTRPATVADLVSALRAEGVLVREWCCLLGDAYGGPCQSTWNEPTPWLYNARHSLCGWELSVMEKELAEAQPFPPAGGVS